MTDTTPVPARVWVRVETSCDNCGGAPTVAVYSERPEPNLILNPGFCVHRNLLEVEVDGEPVRGESLP